MNTYPYTYYYLGLEARVRDSNIYNDFVEAVEDANYIATRLQIPIRVFQMLPNKKNVLVDVQQPNTGKRPLSKKTFLEDE
jgi:hypothetical protein